MLKITALVRIEAIELEKMRLARGAWLTRYRGWMGRVTQVSTQRKAGKQTPKTMSEAITKG